jgi:putative membrane protein
MRFAVAIGALLGCAVTLHAHEGEPLRPHDLWYAWQFPAGIVIPLALSGVLYVLGIARSGHRSARQILAYALGWIALSIALVSPVHPLGEVLFSAHMAQHTVLMLVAAPLLVLGRPLVPWLFALPMNWRKILGRIGNTREISAVWKFVTRPLFATAVQGAALWLWHLPVLYQRTLDNDAVHSVQHLSFLFSALLFWWAIIHGHQQNRHGVGILHIFVTAVHTSVLGALMAFAPSVWYPLYADRTQPWGLSPLEDQQLAGFIMWIPGGVIYLGAALALLFWWIRSCDRYGWNFLQPSPGRTSPKSWVRNESLHR